MCSCGFLVLLCSENVFSLYGVARNFVTHVFRMLIVFAFVRVYVYVFFCSAVHRSQKVCPCGALCLPCNIGGIPSSLACSRLSDCSFHITALHCVAVNNYISSLHCVVLNKFLFVFFEVSVKMIENQEEVWQCVSLLDGVFA